MTGPLAAGAMLLAMRSSTLALLAFALLLGACGGSDDTGTGAGESSGSETSGPSESSGNEASGASSGAADSTGATAELHFTEDVWPIIDSACYCHVSPPPAGGPAYESDLSLPDPATAYAALVDQPALQIGGSLDYVEPGRSEDSYLHHKIAGSFATVGGSGTIMPPGGMSSPADLDAITQWIDGGALE